MKFSLSQGERALRTYQDDVVCRHVAVCLGWYVPPSRRAAAVQKETS